MSDTGNIKKLTPHDWNVTCDVCDRKRKKSQTTMAYGSGDIPEVVSCLDGCADYRHPLNEPPPVIFDGRPVPDARPDSVNFNTIIDATPLPSGIQWGMFYGQRWGQFGASYRAWGQFSV